MGTQHTIVGTRGTCRFRALFPPPALPISLALTISYSLSSVSRARVCVCVLAYTLYKYTRPVTRWLFFPPFLSLSHKHIHTVSLSLSLFAMMVTGSTYRKRSTLSSSTHSSSLSCVSIKNRVIELRQLRARARTPTI